MQQMRAPQLGCMCPLAAHKVCIEPVAHRLQKNEAKARVSVNIMAKQQILSSVLL
jgi:hypothetical protein